MYREIDTTVGGQKNHHADRSVIALFLGHEQIETTSVYLHADMQLKEAPLAGTSTGKSRVRRYRPGDRLLTFLNSL